MARALSAAITALKNTNVARTAHLFRIVPASGPTYYFTDLPDSFVFSAITWLPYLLWDGSVRYTRGLDVDGGTVRLSNVDLTLAKNIRDTDFEGAVATLWKYFIEADGFFILFEGRITSAMVSENSAEFSLVGFLDLTTTSLPKRDYSATCPWRYKGAECQATAPEATCEKTFAACTTRVNTRSQKKCMLLIRPSERLAAFSSSRPGSDSAPPPPGPRWVRLMLEASSL